MENRLFADWAVPWQIRDVIAALVYVFLALLACMCATVAFIGFGFGMQHLGSPPRQWLSSLFTTSPWLEYWVLIQSLLIILFLSRFVLHPYSVHPRQFFLSAAPATSSHSAQSAKAHLDSDLRFAGRLFLISVGLTILLLGATLLIIWVNSARHSGQEPVAAISTYLEHRQREGAMLLNQQLSWFRAMLLVGVAPPVEELAFRGCLYAALRKRASVWVANLLSSLLFVLSHSRYLLNLPQVFLIGMLCAYAFEKTRSLRASVVLHAGWNLLGVFGSNPWVASMVGVAAFIGWRCIHRPIVGEDRRVGWKIYAVLLPLIVVCGYALSVDIAWQAVMELPLLMAVALYAWKRPLGPRVIWRAYGIAYPAWIALSIWVDTIPGPTRRLWQQALASSEPIVTITDLAIEVLGSLLVLGPALLAVWRLGRGTAGMDRETEKPRTGFRGDR